LKTAEFLPLPVGQGLAGNIIQNAKVLTLEDAPADARCIFPREARESGIAAYMGAPVEVDGKVVGVLEAHSSHPHPWSDADLRLLEAAATVVGQLMKSADARGNRLRVESAYLGLSEALQRLRSPDDLMDAAVEVLGHALGVSRALVVELDETGSPKPVRHEYRSVDVQTATGATLGGALASEVVTAGSGKAIAISDSTEGSLLTATAAAELRVQSEMAVAVKLDGTVRSIIYLHQCDRLREWRDDETEFVERVARQLSLSLTSVRSFEATAGEVKSAKEDARQAGEGVARVQALINALPESVLVLDGEGRLNYFNATARERFGLTNEDIGRNATLGEAFQLSDGPVWQQITTAQHPARTEAKMIRAAVVDATGEQGIATASQAAMPVSISVAPFRSSQGGAIVGRIVVLTDVGHLSGTSGELTGKLAELQQKVVAAEKALTHTRSLLSAAEAEEARASLEAEAARQSQAEATTEAEELRDQVARAQSASQQLLETNRLKSDFIVSAGHEIEASLQPVLGITELLGQGQYGPLTPEQQEAIRNIYAWAKRIKSDVDWLIEYGSARSRRLEPSSE
jgi:GAF domain-containing protein